MFYQGCRRLNKCGKIRQEPVLCNGCINSIMEKQPEVLPELSSRARALRPTIIILASLWYIESTLRICLWTNMQTLKSGEHGEFMNYSLETKYLRHHDILQPRSSFNCLQLYSWLSKLFTASKSSSCMIDPITTKLLKTVIAINYSCSASVFTLPSLEDIFQIPVKLAFLRFSQSCSEE